MYSFKKVNKILVDSRENLFSRTCAKTMTVKLKELYQLAFRHCYQNTQQEQLRGGNVYFDLMVSERQTMVGLLHCSGPKMLQNIMADGHDGGKPLSLLQPRRNRKEKERERIQGQDIFQAIPQMTCFLQPCPNCLQLPPSCPFRLLIH